MFTKKREPKLCLFLVIVLVLLLPLYQSLAKANPAAPQEADKGSRWVTISNLYYGYNFMVPSGWYREMGRSPDRWTFYDNAAMMSDEAMLPGIAPAHLTKIDFAVETVANLLPDPEVRNPYVDERGNATSEELIQYLPDGTWTRTGSLPTLVVDDATSIVHGGTQGYTDIKATTVYILDDHLVYIFDVISVSTPMGQESLPAVHGDVLDTLLSTFSVDTTAPAASNFPEQ